MAWLKALFNVDNAPCHFHHCAADRLEFIILDLINRVTL
jgi:hypothetical protein